MCFWIELEHRLCGCVARHSFIKKCSKKRLEQLKAEKQGLFIEICYEIHIVERDWHFLDYCRDCYRQEIERMEEESYYQEELLKEEFEDTEDFDFEYDYFEATQKMQMETFQETYGVCDCDEKDWEVLFPQHYLSVNGGTKDSGPEDEDSTDPEGEDTVAGSNANDVEEFSGRSSLEDTDMNDSDPGYRGDVDSEDSGMEN